MALKNRIQNVSYTDEEILKEATEKVRGPYAPSEEQVKAVIQQKESADLTILKHLIEHYPEEALNLIKQ